MSIRIPSAHYDYYYTSKNENFYDKPKTVRNCINLQSNLDAPRLGRLAELPLRLMSEPKDPGSEDVLRESSVASSLTLRTDGRLVCKSICISTLH